MRRAVLIPAGLLPCLLGCGTLLPGPRYQRDAAMCAFGHDGTGVFYVEERYRLYPFLLAARDGRVLYRYDRAARRHRRIAETDAFSASPRAPLLLYAPEWRRRFAAKGSTPDFLLLDLDSGETRGYSMPRGFDGGYLSYSLPHVSWEGDGSIDAFVYFYYEPGARPSAWRRLGSPRPRWRREPWEVRIDPSRPGGEVARARRLPADGLPRIAWAEERRVRFVSPDGSRELAYARYTGRLRFNTTLSVAGREGGPPEYILKENPMIDCALAGKYMLLSVASAPAFWLNRLLHGAW